MVVHAILHLKYHPQDFFLSFHFKKRPWYVLNFFNRPLVHYEILFLLFYILSHYQSGKPINSKLSISSFCHVFSFSVFLTFHVFKQFCRINFSSCCDVWCKQRHIFIKLYFVYMFRPCYFFELTVLFSCGDINSSS